MDRGRLRTSARLGGLLTVTPHDLAPALLGREPLAVELAERLLHISGEPDAFDGAYLRKTLATDGEALSRSAVLRFRYVAHDRRYHRRPCRFYPPSGVEEIVDGARRRGVHACRLDEVLVGGALDRLDGAEMVQEGALAVRADARDLVERTLRHLALALRPMRPDREAVRLVAQALHEIERRIARRQLQRRLSGQKESLAAGVAVAPLGDADEGHIVDADLRQRFARGLELPLAAVDEHEVGPGREGVGVLFPSPL